MEKTYTRKDSDFLFTEEFDDSVIDLIPGDIAPDNALVDAVIAYDKALLYVDNDQIGAVSVLLN